MSLSIDLRSEFIFPTNKAVSAGALGSDSGQPKLPGRPCSPGLIYPLN